jgi:hypothetical protein
MPVLKFLSTLASFFSRTAVARCLRERDAVPERLAVVMAQILCVRPGHTNPKTCKLSLVQKSDVAAARRVCDSSHSPWYLWSPIQRRAMDKPTRMEMVNREASTFMESAKRLAV